MRSSCFSRLLLNCFAFGIGSLALSGCMSIKLALGLRVRLDDQPVTAITASLADPKGIGPGQCTRLIIIADTDDGKQLATVGPGKGKVLFSSFTYTSTLAHVGKRGVVSLPDDPRLTEGKTPHVHIATNGHPGATADLDIPVRYDVPFTADFSGANGADGADDADGGAGTNGRAGSTDPTKVSPGEDGGDGGNGGNGGDGEDGSDGGHVHAWLTLRPGIQPMLQARVSSNRGEERLFLIDPAGGSLTLKANGGHGGTGGRGGNGGAGGQGGAGSPPGHDGRAGAAGQPGRDGRPGAAGEIRLVVDPSARPYLDHIAFENDDGDGHPGADPVVTVAPVTSFW